MTVLISTGVSSLVTVQFVAEMSMSHIEEKQKSKGILGWLVMSEAAKCSETLPIRFA